jgi:4-methylaminobutanoate oxidase (formaldehyde-forming)
MPATADFVVVGGGIVGCAIAYYLALRPAGRVLLLARRTVAEANTGRTAGLLGQAHALPEFTALVQETYRAISRLEDQLGEPLGMRRVGGLHIAESAEAKAALRVVASTAQRSGLRLSHITPDEAIRLAPWLRPDAGAEIVMTPDDAFIDPYVLTRAYAQAAGRRSVEIREGTGVLRIRRIGGRVTGVLTDHGFIAAGVVIDASGILAGILARQAGMPLPLSPVWLHHWIVRPDERYPRGQPIVSLSENRFYARPEKGGLLFGLRDARSGGLDPRVLPDRSAPFDTRSNSGWETLVEAMPGLRRFFPGVGEVSIARYVSSLSTDLPDGLFVLGALPNLEGFLAAVGCAAASVAASGGVGMAVADLAAGRPPAVNLAPFAATRFAPREGGFAAQGLRAGPIPETGPA